MGQFRVVTSNSARQEEIKDTGQNCPECNSPILPGSNHCYKCGCFLDSSGRALNAGEVTDDMIEDILMLSAKMQEEYDNDPRTIESKEIMKQGAIGLGIGFLVTILVSRLIGVILMVGSIFYMFRKNGQIVNPYPAQIIQGKHMEDMVTKYIVPGVLDKIFDKVEEYDPSGHFSFEKAESSGLIYKSYRARGGSQYVKAIYKGKQVEFSNMGYQDFSEDEDGHRHYTTVFSGFWLGMDLGMPIGADLLIA